MSKTSFPAFSISLLLIGILVTPPIAFSEGEQDAIILLKQASKTGHAIQNKYDRDQALLNIARIQALTGDVKGTQQTASAIKNQVERNNALWEVARAQIRANDFKGAVQTTIRIPNTHEVRDQALGEIARAQAKSGDVTGANKTAAIIEKSRWNTQALRAINQDMILSKASAGDVIGARQAVSNIPDESGRSVIFQFIVAEQVKAKDWTGARHTANSIENEYVRASVLSTFAGLLAAAGDSKEGS